MEASILCARNGRMLDMTEWMEITLVIWNWCVVANIWYQGHANCLDTDTHNDCDLGDDLPQSERLARGVKNYGSAISSSVYLCSSDFCSHDFIFSILAWVALVHLNLLEAIAGIFMMTLVLTVRNVPTVEFWNSDSNSHHLSLSLSLYCRCSHYRRRCRILAPCCNEVFDCRHCHNDIKVCIYSWMYLDSFVQLYLSNAELHSALWREAIAWGLWRCRA